MRSTRLITALVASALVLASLAAPACRRASSDELLVFAAASLAGVMEELGALHEASGGRTVRFNFAGSNALARQVDAGAPAAVLVSADEAQVAWLAERGRVAPHAVIRLIGNALVVVVPRGRSHRIREARDLLGLRRVVLADPAGVPAGVYARQWLEREGVWDELASRVVPALDVRAALAAVAAGDADAGVVYSTDAATTDRIEVALRVPADRPPEITYLAAPIVGRMTPEAQSFLELLGSAEAAAVFERHGFLRLPRGASGDQSDRPPPDEDDGR